MFYLKTNKEIKSPISHLTNIQPTINKIWAEHKFLSDLRMLTAKPITIIHDIATHIQIIQLYSLRDAKLPDSSCSHLMFMIDFVVPMIYLKLTLIIIV